MTRNPGASLATAAAAAAALVLVCGLSLVTTAAAAEAPQCGDEAFVGVAEDGLLYVCPRKNSTAHVGGLSEEVAMLKTLVIELMATVTALNDTLVETQEKLATTTAALNATLIETQEKLANTTAARISCPTGWESSHQGRICLSPAQDASLTAFQAVAFCRLQFGARVCTYSDFQQLCGAGIENPFGSAQYGWFGDHGTAHDWDAEFGVWNRNECVADNDDPARHSYDHNLAFRCCL
eukprot:m.147801 g.147801  ORF g.147801 m.147801 type:complete len:237 (-) comp10108_c0_seq2:2763-3473(-)